jgi:hypothetical protein
MYGRFRLIKPTLGIVAATRRGVSIPKGAVVVVPVAPADGNRIVDVIWDGQEVMMFIQDFRDRAEPE